MAPESLQFHATSLFEDEPSKRPFYNFSVNRRFHTIVSLAAILLMIGSQLCQLFDRWDTLADFGHDSEFMFFVIGLCIGLCILLALLAARLLRAAFLLAPQLFGIAPPEGQIHSYGTGYLTLLFSPPLSLTTLRI
ncbi:MAG: hypothetical protein ACLGQX_09605 [Acidobacteriota bacterium]